MRKVLMDILKCPDCKESLSRKSGRLTCKNNHMFRINKGVAVFAQLDPYLEEEAKAWEDEWKKGVSKKALKAYKLNMKIFKKLKFWEESGEAAKYISSEKDWKVLDLGCGNGHSTNNIKGDLVVGLDLSESQMVRASKIFKKSQYIVGDATKLPFKDNSFDLVVAINLFHHLHNEKKKSLKEVYRVLKKGGKLLSVDPNLTNPVGFVGRESFKLLGLKKVFPTFPQFALGKDEHQFTKVRYYEFFQKSPFKKFKIIPHRIERLLFFATILIPDLHKVPGYEGFVIFVSKVGNKLVKIRPFDWLCYFWIGEAYK